MIKNLKFKSILAGNEKIVYGILLALAVIVYNFTWLNKTFTMSEGWSRVYISMMSEGKVPYRDFYYFLPPLNLLIDTIFWKLSFGYFFVFRLWRLAERILIIELMYHLVNKKLSCFLSAVVCFLGAIVSSANVYDLVGDYNQTVQLLIVLLVYCVVHYFDADNDRSKCKWMLLAGVVGGCMVAVKQTVAVASVIVFGLLFLILAVCGKEKKLLRVIIQVSIGGAVPLAILGMYLLGTHSFSEFIYQVFQDTSSKGSLYDILWQSQVNVIATRPAGTIAILLLFVSRWLKEYANVSEQSKRVGTRLCIFISIFLLGSQYGPAIWNAIVVDANSGHMFVLVICLLGILWLDPMNIKGEIGFLCLILVSAFVLQLNPGGMTEKLYPNGIFAYITEAACLLYIYFIGWVLFEILLYVVKKREIRIDRLVIVCGALASGYSTSMATGEASLSVITAFISVPALLVAEQEIFAPKAIIDTRQVCRSLEVVTLLFFSICFTQKLVCAYSWWGYADSSHWEKTEVSSIECLKGFKFSPEEIKKYDELTDVIANNTDEDSTIFGFPYVKVYNVFLDNYNANGFTPVLFYDTCADDFAEVEAKILSRNAQDIVVWLDIPGCMEVHESIFRGGEYLGQREIQKWFSEVKDTDYTLIGQVDNVFVYKLDDGTEPSYTYIERKTAVNGTAIYNLTDLEECTLDGEGTQESPYLISSLEDLEEFRDLVNSGRSFYGEYVRQTADIDLSDCGSWEPIGIFDSGKLFEGNYNGDGYRITGLYINSPNENVGFFGQLAGTVENIAIIDCDIRGNCVGGIASHGVNASIINCIVTGSLKGNTRAGGIADNLGGSIINCVSDVKLQGDVTAGISGYYTNTVTNCYSAVGNDVSVDDGLFFTEDSVEELNDYLKELQLEDDGELLNEWEFKNDFAQLTHQSEQ